MIHTFEKTYERTVLNFPGGRFVDSVLRGIGQVFLQNNPLTGLLFLIGIFLSGWTVGLYALLGTIVATATALVLGVKRESVWKGLYGYNGTLTALALALYLQHNLIMPVYVIAASIFSAIVTAAIHDVFKAGHFPMLTAPFVVTAWLFVAAILSFGRLAAAHPLAPPHLTAAAPMTTTVLTPSDIVLGFFNGPAQVMFQQNIWTGVAILIGLLVSSRITCVAAVVGSLIGIGVAWALGAPVSMISGGFYGFNPVLTAVAVGGLYYLLTARSALFTLFAAIVTAIVYGFLHAILAPLGMPVLTAAFVLTTWLCVLGKTSLAGLHPVNPEDAKTPEKNLKAASEARSHGGKG